MIDNENGVPLPPQGRHVNSALSITDTTGCKTRSWKTLRVSALHAHLAHNGFESNAHYAIELVELNEEWLVRLSRPNGIRIRAPTRQTNTTRRLLP
jgi:hypothetical protein